MDVAHILDTSQAIPDQTRLNLQTVSRRSDPIECMIILGKCHKNPKPTTQDITLFINDKYSRVWEHEILWEKYRLLEEAWKHDRSRPEYNPFRWWIEDFNEGQSIRDRVRKPRIKEVIGEYDRFMCHASNTGEEA
ncbi:MAG: hypothetical protein LQ344_007412 [Seirophora lacunosa]|nr:MAG: hypothetical protein LQ344_007412 [Seirophora lacunosa]